MIWWSKIVFKFKSVKKLIEHLSWLTVYFCSPGFFVAGNESCPQPQTSEHLAAIEIMKLKHIIIMQNKIDLVKESQAKEQHDQIVKFVQGNLSRKTLCAILSSNCE